MWTEQICILASRVDGAPAPSREQMRRDRALELAVRDVLYGNAVVQCARPVEPAGFEGHAGRAGSRRPDACLARLHRLLEVATLFERGEQRVAPTDAHIQLQQARSLGRRKIAGGSQIVAHAPEGLVVVRRRESHERPGQDQRCVACPERA
jgi:hypothetical protein